MESLSFFYINSKFSRASMLLNLLQRSSHMVFSRLNQGYIKLPYNPRSKISK